MNTKTEEGSVVLMGDSTANRKMVWMQGRIVFVDQELFKRLVRRTSVSSALIHLVEEVVDEVGDEDRWKSVELK